MEKKEKKLTKKQIVPMIVGLLIIIVAAVIIINVFFVQKELSKKRLKEEDVYIYFDTEKYEFSGNITLDYDDHITNLTLDRSSTTLYSEPIYYAKKKKIIIPVNYNLVNGVTGIQNKVNYYTELSQEDEDFYLTGENLNYKSNNSFLFDGSDFYIFMDDGKVMFDNQSVDITPLSYVNYIYDSKDLYIYNYNEDKVYYYDNVTTDVKLETAKYKLNLTADCLTINNKEKILMKNIDNLEKLK